MEMKALKRTLSLLAAFGIMALNQPLTQAATTEEIAKGNCKQAAASCDETIKYCMGKNDNHSNATVINALRDCSNACKATFDYLARGSSFSKKSAEQCLEALNLCTKSCETFSKDNTMKACADECRKAEGNLQKVVAGEK
jgi:hypothetical protein